MAKKVEIPNFEPWWRQVGWVWDPSMDCYVSWDPAGEAERLTGYAMQIMRKSGVFPAPRWFEELYPDWRQQIAF